MNTVLCDRPGCNRPATHCASFDFFDDEALHAEIVMCADCLIEYLADEAEGSWTVEKLEPESKKRIERRWPFDGWER